MALGSGCVQALARADPVVASHACLPGSQGASDIRTRCEGEMVPTGSVGAPGGQMETSGDPTHALQGDIWQGV